MLTDENKREKGEYQFIQEKVVPSKRKKWKRLLSMTGTTLLLGAVFGLTACVVFYASAPWISKWLGKTDSGGTPGEGIWLPGGMNQNQEGTPGQNQPGGSAPGNPSSPGGIGGNPSEDVAHGDSASPGGTTGDPSVDSMNPGNSDSLEGSSEHVPGETGSGTEGQKDPVIVEQRIEGDLSDFKNMYHEISQMAEEVGKSVVQVTNITNGIDWFQNPYATEAETSGLILAADEKLVYILVNYDRIDKASEIRITFEQGVSASASFRDGDTDIGLAVVTVRRSDLPERVSEELQPAPLGESYSMEVGEPVMALGNPNGFQGSMLVGMVTNRENYAHIPDNKLALFQTDMLLSKEGEGIIVNMEGRIIGIITRKLEEDTGLCTALSISRINPLLEMLLNQTPRSYLGVVGMDLTENLAERLSVTGGVYVAEVKNGSPAAEAGLRTGDVILQADGKQIFTMLALNAYLQERKPGDEVTLSVCRMVREDAVTNDYEILLGQKDIPNK